MELEELILIENNNELFEDYLLYKEINKTFNKNIKIEFDLEKFSDEDCSFLFRFYKNDIYLLKNLMNIPDKITCSNGTICTGIEALCILLRRMSYPNRLGDLFYIFSRTKCELSLIFNNLLEFILERFGYLLTTLDKFWINPEYLKLYADKIIKKGSPLSACWGFIDGTVRAICRPKYMQKINFNGHHRVHALKFQSVVTPNGLIAHLFGPIEGSRHDSFLLSESQLLPQLEILSNTCEEQYYLYGDPAYPLRPELQGPFKEAHLTEAMKLFNENMSSQRICVEWEFGKIVNQFSFLDFKKNQKLYLQPVGKYYQLGALLSNCHTCLYGSQTSKYFEMSPPSLKNYLDNNI